MASLIGVLLKSGESGEDYFRLLRASTRQRHDLDSLDHPTLVDGLSSSIWPIGRLTSWLPDIWIGRSHSMHTLSEIRERASR